MEVRNLHFSYGAAAVLRGVDAEIPKGRVTALLGANGCGKSTLLRLMTKGLTPQKGGVYLNGQSIADVRPRAFAKRAAALHQHNAAPSDITVKRLVSYGRTPHIGLTGGMTAADREAVDWALALTDTRKYADTPLGTLSGGQRQRVWLAMALAQRTDYLFLDEPTTFLDVRYQLQILDLIRRLNREYGVTVVMVLHDINQAAHYGDAVIGLSGGKVTVRGGADALTAGALRELYGVALKIIHTGGERHILTVPHREGL
jgi:iron complex transport system ATP-binding protein